jgi:hypothetical protein
MNDSDRASFGRAIAATAAVFNRTISPETMELYFQVLKRYELDAVLKAISRCLTTAKFMPVPATIIEALTGGYQDQAASLWASAARRARVAASSFDPKESAMKGASKAELAVMDRLGGWRAVASTEPQHYPLMIDRIASMLRDGSLDETKLLTQ